MAERSNVKVNYFYNLLYRLSICILPLVVTPYLARTLSPEGNGLYAYSSAVACYFLMFSRLGLEHYGSRTIAACGTDGQLRARTFWSIYAMQVCTSLASLGVYLVLLQTVFAGQRLVYGLQLMYVLSALFDVSWYFYGTEQFRITTIRSLLVRGFVIAGVFLFVHGEQDLPVYTGIMAAAFLLEQLLLVPFALRIPFARVRWADVRVHILPNLKLFVPLAALSVYNWMDKLMLGMLTDNSTVSYYTYAESIINLPKGIVAALGTVMLPRIVKLAASDHLDQCRRTLDSSVTFINALSCALCFGIAGVAPVFVPFFLGESYQPTVMLTIGLAIVMLPMSLIDVIQTQYLVPFHKEKIYILSVSLGAAVNLVLNALLIPGLRSTGAVIGTLGAEFAVCAVQLWGIRRMYTAAEVWRALWPFLICGVLEFLAAYSLRGLALPAILTLLVQIGAGGMVYLVSCAGMVLLVRRDLVDTFRSVGREEDKNGC